MKIVNENKSQITRIYKKNLWTILNTHTNNETLPTN
jgi:hypothetical protein